MIVRPQVRIALNPHWYSQFWIHQFWQLYRQGRISLRPLLARKNPYASFCFEVDGQSCLIDVHDKKEPFFNPTEFDVYFKAQYSPLLSYSSNVRPCWNGTTLKRVNTPGSSEPEFDIVFISSISGGRYHKVALYEALARLPLKTKLVVKLVSDEDARVWGDYLTRLGVEVIHKTMPYKQWIAWQKKGRWCVLTRGKHDCLSFKMLDYMSIQAAVLADYEPTSQWPVPIVSGQHYLNLGLPHFDGDEMRNPDFSSLRDLYVRQTSKALAYVRNRPLQQQIAKANVDYFHQSIADGRAARHVLQEVTAPIGVA